MSAICFNSDQSKTLSSGNGLNDVLLDMLCAIDLAGQSTDHAALSMDPLLALPFIDCAVHQWLGLGQAG